MKFEQLPALNAALNAVSFTLLIFGFGLIRKKKIRQHRAVMLAAFCVSMLFLASYVLHKWLLYVETGKFNTMFLGQGIWRTAYFALLVSHIALAITVPFLASITLFRGLKMRVDQHRAIARITLPIWLYVSITGVIVYFMLYHWFGAQ